MVGLRVWWREGVEKQNFSSLSSPFNPVKTSKIDFSGSLQTPKGLEGKLEKSISSSQCFFFSVFEKGAGVSCSWGVGSGVECNR
jgi:hypothetical protein